MEDIQHPSQGLAGAGAGTGHSEVVAQGGHPVCARVETVVRHWGHSVWSAVVEEPGIQAAKWTAVEAVEVVEDPERMLPTEGKGALGQGEPCLNHSC